MSPKLVENVFEIKQIKTTYPHQSIGFVPTMGALHEGHLSLVAESKKQTDITLVSIFVNPTQFNNANDFETYPVEIENDIKKLAALDVDYVFLPTKEQIYPDGYHFKVHENLWSKGLCGDTRPGHFDGVLSLLLKMFHLIRPQKVFMGLKDYQQWKLVKGMCKDFFLDIEVVGVPTKRDEKGLALSSRNLNLTPEQKIIAQAFAQSLKQDKLLTEIQKDLESLDLKIDYLEERWGRRLAAVFIGSVRLIDNVDVSSLKKNKKTVRETIV